MSWFSKFMMWLGGESNQNQNDASAEVEATNSLYMQTITASSFFTSEIRSRISDNQIVSSNYVVNDNMMNSFPISAENKIFDMRLRNEQHQILSSISSADMSEEKYAILMNHMKVVDYKKFYPDIYARLFSGKGDNFAIAYCLSLKNVIEKDLTSIEKDILGKKVRAARLSTNESNLFIELYVGVLRLMRVLSQVYPAFSKDLIQLNAFEDFFKSFHVRVENIIDNFPRDKAIIAEAHNELLTLIKSFLIKVIEEEQRFTEGAVSLVNSKSDFREALFFYPLAENGIMSLPFEEFSEEIHGLLEQVKKNLFNVSIAYIQQDLSNEVPKMFEDVLSNMIKNFLSMPKDFRSTMYNADGKTVNNMLVDVLNFMNNRLLALSEESHKDTLREVSVIREFSQTRWQTT